MPYDTIHISHVKLQCLNKTKIFRVVAILLLSINDKNTLLNITETFEYPSYMLRQGTSLYIFSYVGRMTVCGEMRQICMKDSSRYFLEENSEPQNTSISTFDTRTSIASLTLYCCVNLLGLRFKSCLCHSLFHNASSTACVTWHGML
jgi:hypothetical protein